MFLHGPTESNSVEKPLLTFLSIKKYLLPGLIILCVEQEMVLYQLCAETWVSIFDTTIVECHESCITQYP